MSQTTKSVKTAKVLHDKSKRKSVSDRPTNVYKEFVTDDETGQPDWWIWYTTEQGSYVGRKRLETVNELTQERTDELIESLLDRASMIELAPKQFVYERDPKDEPYINLAIAAGASYLVSRDNDLLDLMRDMEKGKAFRATYPQIIIIDPVSFLRAIK